MTMTFTFTENGVQKALYSTEETNLKELLYDFESFLLGCGYKIEDIEKLNWESIPLDKGCAQRGCVAIDNHAPPEEREIVYRMPK